MSYRTLFKNLYHNDTFDVEKTTDSNTGHGIIEMCFYDESGNVAHSVWMNKSTSIKFAKTLRTEINKIKEVENGRR